jgi:hypothetical protein
MSLYGTGTLCGENKLFIFYYFYLYRYYIPFQVFQTLSKANVRRPEPPYLTKNIFLVRSHRNRSGGSDSPGQQSEESDEDIGKKTLFRKYVPGTATDTNF